MEIFFVYHKIKPDFLSEPNVILVSDYEYVATVVPDEDVVDVLEDVFRCTNNIDRDWQENHEVKRTNPDKNGFRSTSVGDVVIGYAYNTMNTGIYLVCGCGFKTVGIKYGVQEVDYAR